MKRLVSLILACLLLVGCACASAEERLALGGIVRRMAEWIPEMEDIEDYASQKTDPDGLLGEPGAYVAKTVWRDARIDADVLCAVELYDDEETAVANFEELWDAGATVYQTDRYVLLLDGALTDDEIDAYAAALDDAIAGAADGTVYVVNTNTKRFHYPDCASVKQIKDENRQDYVGDREDLIDQGFEPCKKCNP